MTIITMALTRRRDKKVIHVNFNNVCYMYRMDEHKGDENYTRIIFAGNTALDVVEYLDDINLRQGIISVYEAYHGL
jgi:hypothetical protein